jgi:hypothetical protein
MVYEKRFGKDNMQGILHSESSRYLMEHQTRFDKESPLVAAKQYYVWDNKAGVLMYGLKDLIGEYALNTALKEFHDVYAFRNRPPFVGSTEFFDMLKKHVPDSLQYYLTDSWEKITIYDNKVMKVTSAPTGNLNEYLVHIEVNVKKTYADSDGNEKIAGYMNDFIDIGVFAANSRNKDGRTTVNPLYLEKHKFSAGNHVINVVVRGKPLRAGIDPYNKLIDHNAEDNVMDF